MSTGMRILKFMGRMAADAVIWFAKVLEGRK